jgi:hypothetical protein
MSKCHQDFSINVLHPVRFCQEDVDGQFPVLFFPPSYRMRVNDRLDVVLDPSFVRSRHVGKQSGKSKDRGHPLYQVPVG